MKQEQSDKHERAANWLASSETEVNEEGNIFSAGIDDSSVWGHRIQCHGDSAAEAEQLRDEVLRAITRPESGRIEPERVAEALKIKKSEWENADPERLEPWYSHWVSELTTQGLHAKADIATVLAILSQHAEDNAHDTLRLHRDKMALLEEKIARSGSGLTGETPRTDARAMVTEDLEGGGYVLHPNPKGDLVDADFARQLERELAAKSAILDNYRLAMEAPLSASGPLPQDWKEIFEEYRRHGCTDGWLYQKLQAHAERARSTSGALSSDVAEDAARYRWLAENEAPSLLNVLCESWDFFGNAEDQLDSTVDTLMGNARSAIQPTTKGQ